MTNFHRISRVAAYTRVFPTCRFVHPTAQKGKPVTRIGYAAGAFDLFHVGHLNILRRAREQCDYLIAGVVSDEMLELTKGRAPIIPLSERLEIVRHIKFVDDAVAEVVPDKLETWRSLRFDVFFKGDDWRGTREGKRLEREFAEVGVEVIYFPYTLSTSSTQLRRALATISGSQPTPARAAVAR